MSAADSVDDYLKERFGELSEGAVHGGYDSAGWAGGRIAADSAQLSFGEGPPTRVSADRKARRRAPVNRPTTRPTS